MIESCTGASPFWPVSLQKENIFCRLNVLNNNNPLTIERRKTMSYKKGVIGFAIVLSICALIWSSPLIRAESTEQMYDVDVCVSMNISPMVQSKEITILAFEAKGIMRSNS
jgi:hypothetical protein